MGNYVKLIKWCMSLNSCEEVIFCIWVWAPTSSGALVPHSNNLISISNKRLYQNMASKRCQFCSRSGGMFRKREREQREEEKTRELRLGFPSVCPAVLPPLLGRMLEDKNASSNRLPCGVDVMRQWRKSHGLDCQPPHQISEMVGISCRQRGITPFGFPVCSHAAQAWYEQARAPLLALILPFHRIQLSGALSWNHQPRSFHGCL